MIGECAAPVAGAVGIVTFMGFGGLWIASGLPEAIETGLALIVGVLASFVAAPAVGARMDGALTASLITGCVLAAAMGRWQINSMFTRAATYGLGFVGVLLMLAPYVDDAPQSPGGQFTVTLHYLVGAVSRGLADGFVGVALLLPGVGC